MKKSYVILGGGLAGLSTGWNLLKDQKIEGRDDARVMILEKSDRVGGMSITLEDNGYSFDLGPHNIHSVHDDILVFLKKILGKSLKKYYPTVKLFIFDKYVSYPLKGFDSVKALPLTSRIPALLSFLFARVRMLVSHPAKDDSFADWIKNRFGSVLYGIYFGPYAEKTWKINPRELSNYVGIKRVPVLSISDYLSRLIFNKKRTSHSEDMSVIENFYPVKGVGAIADFFQNEIVEMGGIFQNRINIVAIDGSKNRIEQIRYLVDGKEIIEKPNFVFNTIPLNDFIKLLNLDVPEKVKLAAENLDYCAEHLLFLKINREKVFESNLIYFSSPKIKFNRISDIRLFSSGCVPDKKTGLCVEFTCNIGDEIWNYTPKGIYDYTIGVLEKYNILNRDDVEGILTKKISHAYPRFRKGFQQNMKIILSYLSTIENTVTLGRQGLFSYSNMDDVIKMGFKASYLPLLKKKTQIDYQELFPKYVYF